MADIIGQQAWTGGGKSYLITVTEPGATVTEGSFNIISDVYMRRGSKNARPLKPILQSEVAFEIRDRSLDFRNAIAGKEIGDLVLTFTEDGEVLFKGYVYPDFQRYPAYKTNPTYAVKAFDGIRTLQGFTYDQAGYQALRTQLYNIANKIGLGLQINCFFDWSENSKDAYTEEIDAVRQRVEHLLARGGTYYEALEEICRFFTAQFFQSRGQWYFMQRDMRDGEGMKNQPTSSIGSVLASETVNYALSLTDDDLHRKPTFVTGWPASARVVSKHTYIDFLLRNPDWTDGSTHWESLGDEAGTEGTPHFDRYRIPRSDAWRHVPEVQLARGPHTVHVPGIR